MSLLKGELLSSLFSCSFPFSVKGSIFLRSCWSCIQISFVQTLKRVICADYLLCPCCWLSWQLPAVTASHPGRDSRSCHSCEWPWGSSWFESDRSPIGSQSSTETQSHCCQRCLKTEKDNDTGKEKAAGNTTPEGASCGRGQPWMSFYPALQVLTLILTRELLCREKWPKSTFKASYAPVSPWTLPSVRRGRLLAVQGFCRENAAVPGLWNNLNASFQHWPSSENTHCTMNIRKDRTICWPLRFNQCLASKGW